MLRHTFIAAGCLFLVLAMSCPDADAMPVARLFPRELGEMRLKSLVLGSEALHKIDRLHGTPIQAEFGAVAEYGGGPKRAEIWVSSAGSTGRAAEQVRVMVEKMLAASGSPFRGHTLMNRTDPEDQMSSAVSVHRFFGMGQVHYIFNTGKLVWWISSSRDVDPSLWDRFLFNDH